MNRNTIRLVSTLSLCTALAIGCGAAAPDNAETTAANQRHTGSDQRGNRGGASSGGELSNRDCSVEAVYFAYDSSDLDARARNALENNAQCVNRRGGNANVVGMTDPRGTEEYNLALGDRRARIVTGYMGDLGVEPTRMQVRSVGEEYATGEDESGWTRDRRADVQLR